MAEKQSLYEKQLQRIAESMGDDLIPFLVRDEKQLQRIAESMGEEVVERVPPEKRVRGLTLSERLQGLTDEELRSLSPET